MTCLARTAALVALVPLSLSAQTWQGETLDTGGLIYGSAYAPEYSLVFRCNTPSPQGRPLIETDDHETPRNGPFGIFVEISSALIAGSFEAVALTGVTLSVDGTGYRLPPVGYNAMDDYWSVELAMADPVFAALSGASDLVFDSGQGRAWRYPTDGLATALDSAMQACATGWAQAGYGGTGGAGPEADASLTAEIDAHLRSGCSAGYRLAPEAIGLHDLDRDGVPDRILNWNGVTCDGQMSRPFCGAAYCSIDIFLSTRPGDPQEFLGVGYTVTQAANGAPGLRFGGTAGGCARGECDVVFWWDGTQFRR